MYSSLYEDQEIQTKFVETNESEVPIIAAVKQSQPNGNISKVKDEIDSGMEIVPSIAAASHPEGDQGVDTRPRFLNPLSGHHCLVDSGSAITAIEAGPNDVVRPELALVAANGTLIECYGYKTIQIQMGRKKYDIKAAIAKIKGTIIGWDFIKKYKLSFWWDSWGDCHLHDRQANIKKLLQFVKVPHKSTRLNSIRVPSTVSVAEESAELLFNMAAMKLSDAFSQTATENLADSPEKLAEKKPEIPAEFKCLLNKYPSLLQTNFKAKSKGQPVIHYIDTKDSNPCTAKLRPLMKGSPKEVKGKEAWQELIDFGIVELVDTSKPTLWTSALHLQPKKCGGLRPCGDFRSLNAKTQMDQYPLPHLQKWTHKLSGSKVFSKLDIKKAYHHIEVAKKDRHKTAVLTPWVGWP